MASQIESRCTGCADEPTCPTANMRGVFCTRWGADKDMLAETHPAIRDGQGGDAPMSCETRELYEKPAVSAQRSNRSTEEFRHPLMPA